MEYVWMKYISANQQILKYVTIFLLMEFSLFLMLKDTLWWYVVIEKMYALVVSTMREARIDFKCCVVKIFRYIPTTSMYPDGIRD